MILSLELDSEVREIFFSDDFYIEVLFSEVHGDTWSLLLRVRDEEWGDITLSEEEDLLECIYHFEFCGEEDIL